MRALVLAASLSASIGLVPRPAAAQAPATVEPEAASSGVDVSEDGAPVAAPTATRGADWPWAIVGVGAAMIVGAAVTGGLTLARQSELEAVCTPHSCPPSAERAQAEGRALAFSTDALGIGGLVVALAGVVLVVALPGEAAPPVVASASCGPGGCSLSVGGSF